jgi:hypothetical protein
LSQREALSVGHKSLLDAARLDVLESFHAARVEGRSLHARMKEERDLFDVIAYAAVFGGVELVVLLLQLLDDIVPNLLRLDFRILFAVRGGHFQLIERPVVKLPHVFGRLPRLARHRGPHVELFDRLVEGHLHNQFLRMFENQVSRRDRQERAVDVPSDGPNSRQRRSGRLRFHRLRRRRHRPNEVSRCQILGILFQRHRHSRANSQRGASGQLAFLKSKLAACSTFSFSRIGGAFASPAWDRYQ